MDQFSNLEISSTGYNDECRGIFEISLIRDKIFSHISTFADMANFRLVCRFWRNVSFDIWRRNVILRISLKRGSSSCRECTPAPMVTPAPTPDAPPIKGNEAVELSEFLKLLNSSNDQGDSCPLQLWNEPFVNFKFINCSLHPQDLQKSKGELNQFAQLYGQFVKYLKFEHCLIINEMYFEVFQWIFSENFSNLEELHLTIVPRGNVVTSHDRFNPAQIDAKYKNFKPALEGPANYLKTISLELCKDTNWMKYPTRVISSNFENLLYFLPNVKNLRVSHKAYEYLENLTKPTISGKPIQLTSLTLPHTYSHQMDRFIWLKNYMDVVQPPLESLNLGIDTFGRDELILYARQYYQEFLKSCQTSLRRLDLHSNIGSWRGTSLSNLLEGVELPNLKELYIYVESAISFAALKGLPNLEKLSVDTVTFNCLHDWNQRIQIDSKQDEGINELSWRRLKYLRINYFRLTENSLKCFGKWMPHLRKLELVLHKKTAKVVKEVWPQLEELKGVGINPGMWDL